MTDTQRIKMLLMIIFAMAFALAGVLWKMEAIEAKMASVEKPQIIKRQMTFFQYQDGWVNILYSTEHYYSSGKLNYRDRESGQWIEIKDDDNITPAVGWIEDEESLIRFGSYVYHDEEYFGLKKGGS